MPLVRGNNALKRLQWPDVCVCCGASNQPLVAYGVSRRAKKYVSLGVQNITHVATLELHVPVCEPCNRHIKRSDLLLSLGMLSIPLCAAGTCALLAVLWIKFHIGAAFDALAG
jgi:hypothetical protein